MRSFARLLLLGVVAAMVILPAGPASAHERRQVGPYEFVVGFWAEPAFANQPNGPEVTITRDGNPVVEGVELQVEIRFGEESTTLDIEPAFRVGVFGEEGNYNADFFPTRPGTYEFHFLGTVEDMEVDETFISGPETFSDVHDPAEIAFPEADPSNAELAQRLEAETARFNEQLAGVAGVRALAWVAIGLGALALIVAVVLGLRSSSSRGTPTVIEERADARRPVG